MFENIAELREDIQLALGQTVYMVGTSLIIAVVLGGILGIVLYVTANPLFFKNAALNKIVGAILNVISSIPFLIFMILLLPLSMLIVGTKIGSQAVVVPLSIAATAFFARLAEASLSDVDNGVVEAGLSSGATKTRVIFGLVLPEALSSIVKNITVTAISVLGFSAMAGLVGGGGLGDLAYRYGYQRYETDIMIMCVVILIVLVQVIQWVGESIAKKLDRR